MGLSRAKIGLQIVGLYWLSVVLILNVLIVIPDYAKLLWYARAPSAAEVDVLVKRVVNCFK